MEQTVRSAHFLFNSDKIGRDPCYAPGPRFTRSQSPEWRPHFIDLVLRQTRETENLLQSAPFGRSISGTDCLRCKKGELLNTQLIQKYQFLLCLQYKLNILLIYE